SRIQDLKGVKQVDGGLLVGALTTHAELAQGGQGIPRALADAASMIGDMQVRNRGTIGGSLSHADPAADYPAVILALAAQLRAEGSGGGRVIESDDYFVDLFTTSLKPDEILVGVQFRARPAGKVGTAYAKHPHPASGYAVAGVAAAIATDSAGAVTIARVAVTGACAMAQRLKATEA